MNTLTEPSTTEIADLLDEAATVIDRNGHYKRDLYDHKQAAGGTKPANCRVDLIGAINIAAHGTPIYTGKSLLTWRAEDALLARIDEAAIVTWNDARSRNQQDAVDLLRDCAAALRGEAA